MSQSIFSLDHHLAEIRQVGDELRSAREASAYRAASPATRTSIGGSIRSFLSGLQAPSRPARLATH
jgi:hypothetical protein